MKILVTGNQGYIGTVLAKRLKDLKPGTIVYGLDTGLFAGCTTNRGRLGDTYYDAQYNVDVRDINEELIAGVDAVVALAAVSNDPIGTDFEIATQQINYEANMHLAKICKKNGVQKFVLASSCSMYGEGGTVPKVESDPTNPLTAYAQSKIKCEEDLKKLYSNCDMELIFLRFATACGISDRLRLDLVLNDFVASAIRHKKITVLSDGSPYRPLIDVEEMCNAIAWSIDFGVKNQFSKNLISINIGSNNWNYSIKQLAQIVADSVGGCKVEVNKDAPPDKRSYKVDFSLYESIAGSFYPTKKIDTTIEELIKMTSTLDLQNKDIRSTDLIRLVHIKKLISNNLLLNDLRWSKSN